MKGAGYVYLLHYQQAVGSERHSARHYVGSANNWVWRVMQHRRGLGRARLPEVFYEASIPFVVSIVLVGGRPLERRIKRSGHYDRVCPLCGGHQFPDYRDAERATT